MRETYERNMIIIPVSTMRYVWLGKFVAM